MLQKFLNWIRQVVSKMLGKTNVQEAIGADVSISSEMAEAISLWERLYNGNPPWETETVQSTDLPSAVASEFARLIMTELESEISGSARADWLNEQYQQFRDTIQKDVELGCALGGMAFKPYPTADGNLAVDCTPADRFFPTGFDGSGRITGGVFVDRFTKGSQYYTRFECHELGENQQYTIRNLAYVSDNASTLGYPTPLESVPAWSNLTEELVLANVERPLFGYFRVPMANHIDRDSPLGVSVYSRATHFFKQADEQWARLMWEFEGTELAVDISARAFRSDPETGKPIVPKNRCRLFRAHELGDVEKPLYEVFSPEIRDDPLYRGFNRILQRIEFGCGLAYGTISDPLIVEKTAEEIKTSKQRSYSNVSALQHALQTALEDLLYAMDAWATINRLAPQGKYEASFSWGDSVVTDTDKEFMQRKALADGGYLKPEKFIAWYFGISEEEALEYLPGENKDDDLFPPTAKE